MSVSIIKNSVFMHKASHLYYTPWEYTNSVWAPGSTTYDIVEILADTVSIEQGDPTTETVDWEFGDTPLMSSSTKGERTVTAACIDMSFDIMKNVFGWTVDTGSIMASEGASGESYATMVLTFHSTAAPMVVLPKVSMNAKTTIGTLKTSTGQAELTGTAMSAYIEYDTASASTEIAFIKPIVGVDITIANSESVASTSGIAIGTVDTDYSGNYVLSSSGGGGGSTITPYPVGGSTPSAVAQTTTATVLAIPVQ